jgi:CopG family transcriptional regulator / antitoxin EndoAI
MRTSQTVTISLPPDLAAEVDRLASSEHRTRSELLREAFRQYVERRRRWEQLFAAGRRVAAQRELTEASITTAVKRRRRRRTTSSR